MSSAAGLWRGSRPALGRYGPSLCRGAQPRLRVDCKYGRAAAGDKIKAALLVAPASLEEVEALHPCIVRFGKFPTSPLPFSSLVVGSTTDPYMKGEEVTQTARLWGSDLINLGPVGHINIASGFGRWPRGYELF